MILQTAAILTGAGLLLFITGFWAERPEIAMFGAIIVIGVGATGIASGIVVAVGEDVSTQETIDTVASDDIGTGTHIHTKDVSSQDGSPTGIDFNTSGDKTYISGAATASIYSYEGGKHDLSLATFKNSFDVSPQTDTPVGVEFSGGGDRMYVTNGTDPVIHQYELSTPWNITSASFDDELTGLHFSDPRAVDFNDNGVEMYVAGGSNGTVHEYTLSDPWNVTSASHVQDFDVSSQLGTPTGLDFSKNGTRLLIAGEDTDTVFQYHLDDPFDLSSASFTGNSLDVSSQANRPSGVAYEADGFKLFLSDRQGSTLEQYDTTFDATITEETSRTKYRDIDIHSRFPLTTVWTLLGAVMLIGSAGAASETDLRDAEQKRPPWERGRR